MVTLHLLPKEKELEKGRLASTHDLLDRRTRQLTCTISMEKDKDSKAQVTAIHLIIGTSWMMNMFGVENRDNLTHKAMGLTDEGHGWESPRELYEVKAWIGSAIAKRAEAFGCSISYHSRSHISQVS